MANPPWRAAYDALWATPLGFQLGRYALHIDLRHWVNEGLMALFFLVVGLAFPPGRFDAAVKLGLLLASVLAGAGGALVLLAGGSERRARRP